MLRTLRASRARAGVRSLRSLLTVTLVLTLAVPGTTLTALAPPPQAQNQVAAGQPPSKPEDLSNIPDRSPADGYTYGPGDTMGIRSWLYEVVNANPNLDVTDWHSTLNADGSVTYTSRHGSRIVAKIVNGRIVVTEREAGQVPIETNVVTAPSANTPAAPSSPTPEEKALADQIAQTQKAGLAAAMTAAGRLTGEHYLFGAPVVNAQLAGLVLIRDTYVVQLEVFKAMLQALNTSSFAVQDQRIRQLIELSLRERTAMTVLSQAWAWKSSPVGGPLGEEVARQRLRDFADSLAASGHAADAAWVRTVVERPVCEWEAIAEQMKRDVYDLDPLLVLADGLFGNKFYVPGEVRQETVSDLRPVLYQVIQQGIKNADEETARVSALTTVQQMGEFSGAQYTQVREIVTSLYGPQTVVLMNGVDGLEKLDAARSAYHHLLITTVVTGIVVVFMLPAAGAYLAAGATTTGTVASLDVVAATGGVIATGGQAAFDLKHFVALKNTLDNANNGVAVLGQNNLTSLQKQKASAGFALLLDVPMIGLSAGALKHAKVMAVAVKEKEALEALAKGVPTIPNPMGADLLEGFGRMPSVQKGVAKAGEWGVAKADLDRTIAELSKPPVLIEVKGEDGVIRQVQAVNPDAVYAAQAFDKIGKLDSMIEMAKASAKTPQALAKIQALVDAAKAKPTLSKLASDLPTDLLREWFNNKQLTLIVDLADGANDVPAALLEQFWGGQPPANVIRADLPLLNDFNARLTWMTEQRPWMKDLQPVQWSLEETNELRRILADSDVSKWHMQLDGKIEPIFDEANLETARRFLSSPDFDAIRKGEALVPTPYEWNVLNELKTPRIPGQPPRPGQATQSILGQLPVTPEMQRKAAQALANIGNVKGRDPVFHLIGKDGQEWLKPADVHTLFSHELERIPRSELNLVSTELREAVLTEMARRVRELDTLKALLSADEAAVIAQRVAGLTETLAASGVTLNAILAVPSNNPDAPLMGLLPWQIPNDADAGLPTVVACDPPMTTLPDAPRNTRYFTLKTDDGRYVIQFDANSGQYAVMDNGSGDIAFDGTGTIKIYGDVITITDDQHKIDASVNTQNGVQQFSTPGPDSQNFNLPFIVPPANPPADQQSYLNVPPAVPRSSSNMNGIEPLSYSLANATQPYSENSFCCALDLQSLMIHIKNAIVAPAVAPTDGPQPSPGARWALPAGLMAVFREWSPLRSVTAFQYASAGTRPASRSWRASPGEAQNSAAAVQVIVTSLGSSQGEAFELQIVNGGSMPIGLGGDGVVVEPLKRASRTDAQKALQTLGSGLQQAVKNRVEGYCLDHHLAPPDAGLLYRVASEEKQRKFARERDLLNAADQVLSEGLLHPDSAPNGYADSIKQWVIWREIERWTLQKYADAFVEHSKKIFLASKQVWTKDIEKQVRDAVPNRWRDMNLVVERANRTAASRAAAAQ